MAKNKPTGQHFVPKSYLAAFVDPNTPKGHTPYVWVFKKGEKKGRNKSPSNILKMTDLYTLELSTGTKDYRIEKTLNGLESKYATIFRKKIKHHLPLNEEEHIYLCAFVSTMLQRTLRHRDNLNRFYDELIEHTESMERQHGLKPEQSQELREYKKNSHKLGVIQNLPDITKILMHMGIAFLCASGKTKFITSDDPCNLFNPDLQWQRFEGPGLSQKNIQVTLPLSPDIMLCMSWSNLKGYIKWEEKRVNESNRMIAGHCYKEFVSCSSKVKRAWLRNYPMDLLFILKILRHKLYRFIYKLKINGSYARKR